MFARYFVELPIPADELERALSATPSTWIAGLASDAQAEGDRLLAEVGFGDALRVERTVEIELGAPVRSATKIVVPLRWSASGGGSLLPSLDADLEIASLGSRRTQLALSARYVPPLGVIGKVLDRAVLHRVAEATIKDFLDRVRETLMAGADHSSARPD